MCPNDFKIACNELQEDMIEFTCDKCGCNYDNDWEAEMCCEEEVFECAHCGTQYEDKEEAEMCCGGL